MSTMTLLKSPAQIQAMREGGAMLATVLMQLERVVVPGMTPKDLSKIAGAELAALGGQPAFAGFEGYPDIICISVNDQVQHAIPTDEALALGDIVNFDFGVRYQGLVTDAGITVGVGPVSAADQRLITATAEALAAGIAVVRDGARVGDISAAVEARLRQDKLGIVQELAGHGIGEHLHEDPSIPNYGRAGKGPMLRAGMTICIEPIANLGSRRILVEADDWTIVTADGSRSAQFEHTILVTDTGSEVLTARISA